MDYIRRSIRRLDTRHFSKVFLRLVIGSVIFTQAVLAKPRSGYVTLINATPYDWKLTSSHSYQVEWDFPSVVKAGTAYEQYIKFKKDHHDDGAEAYYSIVNSPSPASFVVKACAPKHIEIQFLGTLSSLNNPESSVINLGFVENGAVSFVLSGNGNGPYTSSNPPVAWMQSTLSSIGCNSLREIAMPASHDSGMSEITRGWGGVAHNTKTQTANIFQQLIHGARVFDIRPVHWHGTLYTGHFTKLRSGAVGSTGRKISDIVKDINTFTSQYPGELIILDISHQMNAKKSFRDFGPELWTNLYEELAQIQALWAPSNSNRPEDLSSLPLSTFITPGSKSAVLVRLPDGAPLPELRRSFMKRKATTSARDASTLNADPTDGMIAEGPALEGDDNDNFTATDDDSYSSISDEITIPAEVPLSTGTSSTAFVHESRLPLRGSYSGTDVSKRLISDQLAKLALERPDPQAPMYKAVWTITQRWRHITDAGNPKTSITADAVAAHRALFANLWPAMSRNTYPNVIEVDDIHNSQVTALCMATNDYFASPRLPSRSTTTLGKRIPDDTAAENPEHTPIIGFLETLGFPKPEKVTLSHSGCDVVEIVFKNTLWCWDIMTPEEKTFWEERKAHLQEKYRKEAKKKAEKHKGKAEKVN